MSDKFHRCPHDDKYAGSKDGFITECRVQWNPSQPDRINFFVATPEMVDEHGEKPGMWLTFEGHNIKSANFDPAYFNRCARWLEKHGLPYPPKAPMKSRLLKDRMVAIFSRM